MYKCSISYEHQRSLVVVKYFEWNRVGRTHKQYGVAQNEKKIEYKILKVKQYKATVWWHYIVRKMYNKSIFILKRESLLNYIQRLFFCRLTHENFHRF